MSSISRLMPDFELALMRRSLRGLADECERCGRCHRSLLIGEKVYEYASGALRCELCRAEERAAPSDFRRVHGPEFGHTLKLSASLRTRPPRLAVGTPQAA